MLTLSIRYAFNPDKLGAYPFYFSERWAPHLGPRHGIGPRSCPVEWAGGCRGGNGP
jgi:hypothetical protein